MRIIINTTTLIVGGGIQVALSIINELNKSQDNEFHIFLSSKILDQLNTEEFPNNFFFYIFTTSPAGLSTRKDIVKKLVELELKIKPDVVFSVFGPSYWRPVAPHICGFALPWLVYPDSPIHEIISLKEKFKNWLIKKYKWFHFKNEVDYLWCETEDVKVRINKTFGFPLEKITVISNTYSSVYTDFLLENSCPQKRENGVFRMITISAFYRHKNIDIIKAVIPFLIDKIEFEFILTIPFSDYERLFNKFEQKYVKTIGPISAERCPLEYSKSDAMFLPTLLECFSANYAESMVMSIPIITSDLSFAKSICGNAAVYFDPLDPRDIADKIINLANNNELSQELIRNGKERLLFFSDSKHRVKQIIDLCERSFKK